MWELLPSSGAFLFYWGLRPLPAARPCTLLCRVSAPAGNLAGVGYMSRASAVCGALLRLSALAFLWSAWESLFCPACLRPLGPFFSARLCLCLGLHRPVAASSSLGVEGSAWGLDAHRRLGYLGCSPRVDFLCLSTARPSLLFSSSSPVPPPAVLWAC